MAGRRAMQGDVGQQIRLLQMGEKAIEPVRTRQEKNRRHRAFRRVSRQIPKPRIPMAQRQGQARPRHRLHRRIRQEVLPLHGDQIPKQTLQVQSPWRAEEDVPEPGARLAQAHRPAAMRRLRHDGLLGRGEILGTHPLHGPLERRDNRIRPIFEKRRPIDLFRRAGHLRRIKRKAPRTENDLPLGSRLGVLFEGIQRKPSAI